MLEFFHSFEVCLRVIEHLHLFADILAPRPPILTHSSAEFSNAAESFKQKVVVELKEVDDWSMLVENVCYFPSEHYEIARKPPQGRSLAKDCLQTFLLIPNK